ncbi:hypothetical protein [Alicyclobacillus acidocaldarius]|uniref:Uncharacterized protein n=1 Tax=Alicyclobacillus acidocaldarius (strain Tc-4-1) TaxID=1048834 RepID=F8IKP9_ALIAT|nr:hypothetical protein [Alicyclobacillus acidocaldarius]AEJ44815.1 hypothetical protein TC41_2925 [Alicyclobacillus acidocaldarius subsp. acidocaldarius Tc-4-1]
MSRRHRTLTARHEENHWGWPVIGGIGVGLGATLLCIPQSREAMLNAVGRLFDRAQNAPSASRPSTHRNSPYGP